MEIEQSFTVPYPRHAVWARFHDTPGIVACLPGASLTAPVEKFTISVQSQDAKRGALVMEWGSFKWIAPIVVE